MLDLKFIRQDPDAVRAAAQKKRMACDVDRILVMLGGRLVEELGALQANLRFVHLDAHLEMKEILTPEQVQHYDQLRGYDASAPPGQQHHGGHH